MMALDHAKLAAVLGMLGSAHDGEVIAAARQAERLRAAAGLTWPDILMPQLPPPDTQMDMDIADAIALVLEHGELLSAWESEFVTGISRAEYSLSDKQLAVLERLVRKARRAEARAQ